MHGAVATADSFGFDLIGLTTGLLITLLLLILTLRAAKLPGTPLANIGFAACTLLWTSSGLAGALLPAFGAPPGGRLALLAVAAHFSSAAALPLPILAIWRSFAVQPWQQTAMRVLQVMAGVSAAFIAFLFWAHSGSGIPFRLDSFLHMALTAMAICLVLGAVISLRRKSTPRAVYLPSLVMVVSVTGATLALAMARHLPRRLGLGSGLASTGAHLVLLMILCMFLLFARFRYADVFLRYGVRIVLAGIWAAILAFAVQWSFLWVMTRRSPTPGTLHILVIIVVANWVLLSFTFLDERASAVLNRLLFRAPDYAAARSRLAQQIRHLQSEAEIEAAVEEAARVPLELSCARLVAVESLAPSQWPAALLEGETVEIGATDRLRSLLPAPYVEVLIPVTSTGRVTHVLLVAPGPARPGLVTHNLDYLRAVAAQCGNRLDALHREREAIERQSRESLLLQQVTEAELRALRAQINPHFLFNSLNTIADLIVRDPSRAEAMTLRLAGVFRHVLAHSSRPLTSIRDEIEFLRTYLYIEEVRFGDRLQVHIDVAPEVAGESIPSLILQPLVENALRHGFGPKPGPGRLWISARAHGDEVWLTVEDDGVGPGKHAGSQGLGLTNTAERLKTLYQDRAGLTFEARAGGGSCVTVRIPRTESVSTL